MTKFVKAPPTNGRSKYDWDKEAKTLKTRPGDWGVIEGKGVAPSPGAAYETARRIRAGEIAAMKKGEFEATARGTTVYARYVGKG